MKHSFIMSVHLSVCLSVCVHVSVCQHMWWSGDTVGIRYASWAPETGLRPPSLATSSLTHWLETFHTWGLCWLVFIFNFIGLRILKDFIEGHLCACLWVFSERLRGGSVYNGHHHEMMSWTKQQWRDQAV